MTSANRRLIVLSIIGIVCLLVGAVFIAKSGDRPYPRQWDENLAAKEVIAIQEIGVYDLFSNPTIVRATGSDSRTTTVYFERPITGVSDEHGRERAERIALVTFEAGGVTKVFKISKTLGPCRDPGLSRAVRISSEYLVKHKRLPAEFEVFVMRGGSGYNALYTWIPNGPESQLLKIDAQGIAHSISSPGGLPLPDN